EHGLTVLDATESGGVTVAKRGSIQVMVDGEVSVFHEVKNVLGAVGHNVGYMGPIGAGTIAKLVHNMISIVTRALVAEGFALGVKAGVKPEALLEAIRGAAFGQGPNLSHMLHDVDVKRHSAAVRS